MNPACPNCGTVLAKLPTRKTKCASCGQFMFVKYTPTDPVKRLVTAARAAQIEQEWAERDATCGAQQRRDEITKSLGLALAATDAALREALESCALSAPRRHERKMAAHYLARMADCHAEKREWAARMFDETLLSIQESGFSAVKIALGQGGRACSSCEAAYGAIIPIPEALALRIPNPACASWRDHGVCCAFWAAAVLEVAPTVQRSAPTAPLRVWQSSGGWQLNEAALLDPNASPYIRWDRFRIASEIVESADSTPERLAYACELLKLAAKDLNDSSRNRASSLRIWGEAELRRGNAELALERWKEALEVDPRVGVKRALSILKAELAATDEL